MVIKLLNVISFSLTIAFDIYFILPLIHPYANWVTFKKNV